MIDSFETIMMKMEKIHNHWPSLRFGQVVEIVTDAVKDNFNLTDDALIIMLDKFLEENL